MLFQYQKMQAAHLLTLNKDDMQLKPKYKIHTRSKRFYNETKFLFDFSLD